jgi:nucleotide-binding universal stress UspA family protein
MFTNVLVGVDGRSNGSDAVALAARLADADRRLTLVHVHRGERAQEQASSRELLEHEREQADVAAELVSAVSPSPGRGLHQQAEQLGADLLVVGSSSRGALGRAVLGNDTRAALNGATCAVAVAPSGYAVMAAPIGTVGVAYNGSLESAAALGAARELAARTGASVRALEVVSIPSLAYAGSLVPAVGESIDDMLEEASARMQQLPDVEGRAVYGLPGEELAAFSDSVDVLVVGSRGYGPVRRLVLGSTSDYLERHARSALLVLPRATAA